MPALLWLAFAAGLSAEPMILKTGIEVQSANNALEALSGDFTFEQAQTSNGWKHAGTNFGYLDKPLWLRLQVNSAGSAEYVWMTDAFAREIHVYVVRNGSIAKHDLGVARRLTQEDRFLRPVLALRLEEGLTEFYFEVRTDTSVQFTSDFLTPDAYQERRDVMIGLYAGFLGALFLMAFYNLFVYLSTRETSYRSYITYALAAFLYFFSQSGMLLMFAPGAFETLVMRFHLVVLGPYITFMGLFARSFLRPVLAHSNWDRALFGIMAAGVLILGAALLPGLPFSAVARPGSILVIFALAIVFGAGVAAWRRGYRPARYYTVSIGAFVAGAVLLALRQIGAVPHNLLTAHAIQIGTLAEMALLAFALSDRINLLKRDAQARMDEVSRATAELERSEAKYRSIFQDSTDMIFTLDSTGKILSLNNAAYRTLGYESSELEGRSILDLVQSAGSMDLQAILLRDALTSQEPSRRFRLQLHARDGTGLDVSMKLEAVTGARGVYFQGRAFLSASDPLLACLSRERLSYSVENFFATAELLNQRITRNLPAFFSEEECIDLQVVLREMLVNAIEHGNLEITYEEKTAAQLAGDYLHYAASKQKMGAYAGRRIHVISSLCRRYALFHIEDEGPGFDHVSVSRKALDGVADLTLSHGRGIAISRQLLDRVTYSKKGNAVTLLKETRKTP